VRKSRQLKPTRPVFRLGILSRGKSIPGSKLLGIPMTHYQLAITYSVSSASAPNFF